MQFDKVLIICAGLQQRVAKMAYCLKMRGNNPVVLGESVTVAKEFAQYIEDIPFVGIPVIDKLKRTPIGRKRRLFIRKKIEEAERSAKRLLIIVRDVNYGTIVSKIVKRMHSPKIVLITDVADNYDLLYQSTGNMLKRVAFYLGFQYLTRTAFRVSDGLIVVTPVNKTRIENTYRTIMSGKPIYVMRNLPLKFDYWKTERQKNSSFVYVGKIDEVSRDPMYILDKMCELPEYTLHFYSNEKKNTIDRIKEKAKKYGIEDRIVFHEKVNYDDLSKTISQYTYGLVPHKRSPLTDYTVPNKLYDYKSAGMVSIMSDCPSLVNENEEFGFGLVYSREKDNFVQIVREAAAYQLDTEIRIPEWQEVFNELIESIERLDQQSS